MADIALDLATGAHPRMKQASLFETTAERYGIAGVEAEELATPKRKARQKVRLRND